MAKIFGGSASRFELYALFVAAVVLIGGGVSGAIVLSQSDSNPSQSAQVASSNDSQTSQASSSATDATTQSGGAGDVSNLRSPNATTSSQTESLSTTTLPLCSNYFNGCGNSPAPTQAPSSTTSTSAPPWQVPVPGWQAATTTTTAPPLVCAGRNVLDGFSATDGNWFAGNYGALGQHIASLNPPGCPHVQFGFKPCISHSIDPNVYQVVYVESWYLEIGIGDNRFDLGYAALGDECALQEP